MVSFIVRLLFPKDDVDLFLLVHNQQAEIVLVRQSAAGQHFLSLIYLHDGQYTLLTQQLDDAVYPTDQEHVFFSYLIILGVMMEVYHKIPCDL